MYRGHSLSCTHRAERTSSRLEGFLEKAVLLTNAKSDNHRDGVSRSENSAATVLFIQPVSEGIKVMQMKLPQVLCFVCACICMDSTASAQGRGNASRGLGMAAGNAAAAAAPGMANASRATTQVGTSGSGKGVNVGQENGRQNGGLPRSISQVPGVAAGVVRGAGSIKASKHADLSTAEQNRPLSQEHIANPSENWARIQQQRSQRAEHLRTVAERNGNTQLITTADRMDANALRNFERQQASSPLGTGVETSTMGQHEGSAGVATTAASVRPPTTPKKGLWFRSR